jgi:hypothetical protein
LFLSHRTLLEQKTKPFEKIIKPKENNPAKTSNLTTL